MSESASLRLIPAVDQLCEDPVIAGLLEKYSRDLVLDEIRTHLDGLREATRSGQLDSQGLGARIEQLPASIGKSLQRRLSPSLRKVINATGVIIHTNLGRAPISRRVATKVLDLASGYSNLELDLEQGKRGHRDRHLEALLTRLLGCGAATVCNNNAAALLLILNTFALGKKVLVSRGELVEIGGSFRIPDIMQRSGARLQEVGTTNKTRKEDFAEAVDEETGLILSVHPSNYRIVGFTQSPTLEELVALSERTSIPLAHDVGSGLLFDSAHPALREEPSARSSLEQGAGLVCFSGDKLLGGPQAGIILGTGELIGALRTNPMMRALRIDKMTSSLLEHTLLEHEKNPATREVEVRRMILTSGAELRKRVERLAAGIRDGGLDVDIVEAESVVGGGSAPGQTIPGPVLSLSSPGLSANQLEKQLRLHQPPILVRIANDRLSIDLRTVLEGEEEEIAAALGRIGKE